MIKINKSYIGKCKKLNFQFYGYQYALTLQKPIKTTEAVSLTFEIKNFSQPFNTKNVKHQKK